MGFTFVESKGHNISRGSMETNIEFQEYKMRLELLYEVAQQASSVSEVSDLLTEISHVIQRMLQASASSLFMIDEEKREFCLRAATGEKLSTLKQIRLGLDSGIIGWVARNGSPVVVNNVSLDERFNKDVDQATGFVTKSIIAAPLLRGQKVIGVLEMINKVGGGEFNDKDLGLITEFASTEALILLVSMAATLINNFEMCQAVQDEYKSTVETLVTAADAKDPYAYGHSRRVKEYVLLATDSLNFSSEELKFIEFGALLHDIGKIGIDDRILRKSGPLTTEEWYIIRKHALRGANIVSEIPNLRKAADIILYHHEWYDGTGYPEGLKGEQIPIGARLVAVADAFDTMTTDHSYRAALNVDKAMSELVKGSGTQFCPVAVKAFISGFRKYKGELAKRESDQTPREQVQREAKEVRKTKCADKLAKKEAAKAAKEEAKREAEEARKAKCADKLAKKEAAKAAKEEAKREAVEARKAKYTRKAAFNISSGPYEGEVQMVIKPLVSYRQVNQFRKCLRAVKNLKIVSESWSEDKGNVIVVSVQEPMALGDVLSNMPPVEKLYSEAKDIVIVLKPLPEDE